MAGGGVSDVKASGSKAADKTPLAINTALFSQLGSGTPTQQAPTQQAPAQQYQPTQVYQQPQRTYQPQQQYQTPTYQSPYQAQQSQTLNIPGFQGMANPFYTAPRQQAPTQQSNLMQQYNAYQQQQAASIEAGKQAQATQAAAMQKAYADAQAAAKAKADAAKAQAEAALQYGSDSSAPWDPSYNGVGGATGGIADLTQGFK